MRGESFVGRSTSRSSHCGTGALNPFGALTPRFTLFAFPLDSEKVNCDKAGAFEGKRSVPCTHWVQLPKGGVQCECRSEIHG